MALQPNGNWSRKGDQIGDVIESSIDFKKYEEEDYHVPRIIFQNEHLCAVLLYYLKSRAQNITIGRNQAKATALCDQHRCRNFL